MTKRAEAIVAKSEYLNGQVEQLRLCIAEYQALLVGGHVEGILAQAKRLRRAQETPIERWLEWLRTPP